MEFLPTIPQEQILSYLDVTDLLNCSRTSVGWRAVVNSDYIWEKICMTRSNITTIHYITTVQSNIQPTFEVPESSKLDPLCHWRLVYMKLQHLKGNWRNANHYTFSVTDLAYNHYDLKIDNDVLVTSVNDNQCEVWDIKTSPRKQKTVICALKNAHCKCIIHVVDNRLVIVQDTLLQIYSKTGTDKQFNLKYRKLFNCPEIESNNIPGSLHIDEWYEQKIKRRPTHLQAYNVGNYFIGLATNGSFDSSSFHVWDTSTGSKLKEQPLKEISMDLKDAVYNLKLCSPKIYVGKILINIHYTSHNVHGNFDSFYTVLYLYDLKSLMFKRVKILKPHVPWIFFEDNLILTICHNQVKLSVYDAHTGETLAAKCYEEIINPDSVQVHGDHIGFTTGGDLVVLKKKDFDLVFTTAIIKFSSNLFGFDFVFLDWNLVLIARWDKVNKIEVWSVKERRLLNTLNASGLMFPCNNSAKFFVWNEMVTTIYMLQFW